MVRPQRPHEPTSERTPDPAPDARSGSGSDPDRSVGRWAPTRVLAYSGLVVVLGVLAGLGAALLTWILHATEEIVYGHGEEHGQVLTDGVEAWRMSLGVAVVSVVLALAWWLLRRRVKLVGVEGMVAGKPTPVWGTLANAGFQMIGVGAGLPVGREVAPRELGGLAGERLTARLGSHGLTDYDRRVLIGAAAGAGLAAVYQVPLGGAVFAMELLLAQISTTIAATCLSMSVIAVIVSRVVVDPVHQFAAPMLDSTDWHLLVWALVVGLLLGPFGGWFGDVADHVKATSQRGNLTLLTLPLAGIATAVYAWWFPLVLGNGRAAMQTAFLGIGLGLALATLVGKCLLTMLTLRAGAVGGTLAPGFAAGALSGAILGHLAQLALPGIDVPIASLAVLGAAAVLATSLRGPATGMLMIVGITGQGHDAFAALALAVGAAYATSALRPKLPGVPRPRP